MKKKLTAMLAQKKARRSAIFAQSEDCTDVAELRSLNTELDGINEEIRSLEGMLADLADLPDEPAPGVSERTGIVAGQVPGVVAASAAGEEHRAVGGAPSDPYATPEYRSAFMAFAKTGQITPELRANATTTTGDLAAIIPTTIMREVIKQLKSYGQIYSMVRKLAVPGGVQFPISTLNPVASWITEAKVSDRQRVDMKTSVSFSFYGLECRIAVSLLAETVSLDVFETSVTELITEAMMKAMDIAIVKGSGSGQPTGITVDTRVPAANKITLSASEFTSWSAWKKKVFAKLPMETAAEAKKKSTPAPGI